MDTIQIEISAEDYVTYKKCWVRIWLWSVSKIAEK